LKVILVHHVDALKAEQDPQRHISPKGHAQAERLAARDRTRGIVGINIGKNFDTPIERAAEDYLACLAKVYAHASYVAVNISSPNTQRLRELQQEDELARLLAALKREQRRLAEASKEKYGKLKKFSQPIVTPVAKASRFWPAEDYHQDFYKKNPVRYNFYVTGCGRYNRLNELWGGLRK